MIILTNLLTLYADVFGGDLLRYVLGAGGTYLVINILLARKLAGHRVRPSDPPSGQILREIVASLRTVLIFAAAGTSIGLGARAGVITIYNEIGTFGWPYFAFSTAALILLHDAWFYWTHRALHYPPLFRRLHRLHHRSHQPTAFTSYSFDIGEAVVNAIYLPLILLVLPAHPIALFIFVTHMMLRNAIGHCGVEVFPANRDGRPFLGWLTTVTHHDLHHAQAKYNLGLYFTWWDRLMGTEHPRYRALYAKVAPRWGMGRLTTAALVVVVATALITQRAQAFELTGRYASPGIAVIVQFDPCNADKKTVCGRLVWVWDVTKTPHVRIGENVLIDLVFDGTAWRGRLTDPETGRTFRGRIDQRNPGTLRLKGCAGPFCARQTWHSTRTLDRVLAQSGG